MINDDSAEHHLPAAVPLACCLGPEEQSSRLADMRSLGQAALLDAETGPRKAVLRFAASEETRTRLQRLIAAEASCCAFLDFTVRADDDPIVLTILAPEDAEPVLEDLVGAFAAGQTPS
jgi:hypothetical protein